MARQRNQMLGRGVPEKGRTAMFKARGKWKFVKKGGTKKAKPEAKEIAMNGRYVEADVRPRPLMTKRRTLKPQKLRGSIKPGSVLIILSGRFRGTRVVFLKQLESGLLLVTGPFKLNGCPVRRVNMAYVIGTSTSVDISGVKIPENVTDSYFDRESSPEEGEEGFFSTSEKINEEWLSKRKEVQKQIDTQILAAVDKVPQLSGYLKTKFSLKKGQVPHLMKF